MPGALDPAEQPGAVQDGFDMGEAFQVRRIEFLGEQAGVPLCRWVVSLAAHRGPGYDRVRLYHPFI